MNSPRRKLETGNWKLAFGRVSSHLAPWDEGGHSPLLPKNHAYVSNRMRHIIFVDEALNLSSLSGLFPQKILHLLPRRSRKALRTLVDRLPIDLGRGGRECQAENVLDQRFALVAPCE